MNKSFQSLGPETRSRQTRRLAAVPAMYMSPNKGLTAPHPASSASSSSHSLTTRLKVEHSDSSGVCSDLSFYSASPGDKAPKIFVPSSLPVTVNPRPRVVKIGSSNMSMTDNTHYSWDLGDGVFSPAIASSPVSSATVAPPSLYADSDSSPDPVIPAQFADSPQHKKYVSKPIGLKVFSGLEPNIIVNSVSPKRIRISSECQEDDEEDSGDSMKSPSLSVIADISSDFSSSSSSSSSSDEDDNISLLLSPESKESSSGFEGDPLTDFEAVNIRWTYGDKIFTIADFAQDIYDLWRLKDNIRTLSPNFLAAQRAITEEFRKTILLTVLGFRRNLDITHETIHLAVYIFDKCLDTFQVGNHVLRDVAAVCLVIASKCEDYAPLKLLDVICMELTQREVFDSSFEAKTEKLKKIRVLEKKVLSEINYELTFVTPFMFMNFFHQLLRSCLYTIQMSNYLLELSLLSTKYRDCGSVFTAHAVVCLAKALVCSSTVKEAIQVINEAEIGLIAQGKITPGYTRGIMRLLLEDMELANSEQHEVWQEYNNDDRCCASSYSIPDGLSDALQQQNNGVALSLGVEA